MTTAPVDRSVDTPTVGGPRQDPHASSPLGTVTAFASSSAADLADLAELARRMFMAHGVEERLEIAAREIHRHVGCPVAVSALDNVGGTQVLGTATATDRDAVATALEALADERRTGEAAVGSRLRRGPAVGVHAGPAGFVVLDPPRGMGRFLQAAATVVSAAIEGETTAVDPAMSLAWMAHEIRSPLAGVRTALDQALVGTDPTNARSLIERGRRELSRISTLAESLLRWGVPHGDDLELRRVSLVDIVRETVEEADLELPTHRIAIEGSDDAEILVDPVQLKVAIVNLLRNAVAYSSRGTVTVSVTTELGRAAIVVADPGSGATTPIDDAVFEAFIRGDDRLTVERRGAGLGLFICRKIVEAHGGSVCAERRIAGTAFRIELPTVAVRGGSRCAS
jgi:Histidine kinase-, DNA gyrase B-, and HSP90-like ATPase